MFGRKKINLKMINTSSKIALKMTCIQSCNGDLDKAERLYKFLSDGMDSIPEFEQPKPTAMQQASQAVGSAMRWVKENKDDLMQAWNFFQTMRGGATIPTAAPPPVDIPPLPNP